MVDRKCRLVNIALRGKQCCLTNTMVYLGRQRFQDEVNLFRIFYVLAGCEAKF